MWTPIVILLPSYKDAYGPPLAVIMYLGKLSKEGPKVPKKDLKGLPALAETKRGNLQIYIDPWSKQKVDQLL